MPLWFLEELGVSTAADARAIRRAYAMRLKQIDQATQPDAFIRLRSAYELALTWRQNTPLKPDAATVVDSDPTTGYSERAVPAYPSADSSDKPAPTPDVEPRRTAPAQTIAAEQLSIPPSPTRTVEQIPLPSPHDEAAAIMRRMQERLNQGEPPTKVLGEAIKALHQCSLAAQPAFEAILIDGLAQQHLSNRLALFQAAVEQLQWEEVGRLRGLGQLGQWVMATLGQQHAWLTLPTQQRDEYAWWLDNSYREPLTESATVVWPKVDQLLRVYPNFLLLSNEAAHFNRWKAAYAALPDVVRKRVEMFQDMPSPRAFRRANPRTSFPAAKSIPIGAFIWLMVILAQHIPGNSPPSSMSPPAQATTPAPPSPFDIPLVDSSTTDMHKQCRLLYDYVHAPGWRPPEKARRAELISSLDQCQLTGQWPVALANDWAWQVLHWAN